jgi:hypothetical protein
MTRPDRRATPRLEVLDQLHGYLVTIKGSLVVREIGRGGFSIESDVPFPLGARHQFRFSTPAGAQVIVDAVVVHTRPVGGPGTPVRHVTGLAFCHDAARETQEAVGELIAAVTSVPRFR